MRHAALAVCAALTAWCASGARASVLYASSNDTPGGSGFESIWTIDQTSGAAGLLGDSGVISPIDLASDWRMESFRLWACDSYLELGGPGRNHLISIDPDTGMSTQVGHFGTAFPMATLAFNALTGKLYGTTVLDELYEIDPDTAASTYIGTVTIEGIIGLGFDLSGTLYGFAETSQQIVSIKTDTAVASAIGPPGLDFVTDLAARPEDGVMFAVASDTDSIYRIDLATGGATLVGPHGQDVNFMVGLAFGPIPEPATVSLLAIGGLALLKRRR